MKTLVSIRLVLEEGETADLLAQLLDQIAAREVDALIDDENDEVPF